MYSERRSEHPGARRFYKRPGKGWIHKDYLAIELQNVFNKINRLT